MSYDIDIINPKTQEIVILDNPHSMKGGTYQIGGEPTATFNITYNYSPFFQEFIDEDKGIRLFYGMTISSVMPILETAIAEMKGDSDPNYWAPTEGNAKKALVNLLALCKMVPPDSILTGD